MKHQHFIPRSYLKNFSTIRPQKKKNKAFVAIYDLEQRQEIIASTADVCVNSGLYTLPDHPHDPYALEKYYALHIDEVYPRVYNLLVSNDVTRISKQDKRTILNVLLSLYFRTPKVLDALNRITDDLIERSLANISGDTIKIKFGDSEPISFRRNEADKVRRGMREQNRITYLETQLAYWQEFVRHIQ